MKYNTYTNEIQTILTNISDYRLLDSDKVIHYCEALISYATPLEDAFLLGYAYYYMSESYFSFHEYNEFLDYLIKGIPYQQECNQKDLLALSYNMLGINAESRGDFASALDYYLTAKKLCSQANLKYETGLIYTNMGHLYLFLNEYSTALNYLQLGLKYLAYEKENSFYETNALLNLSSIGNCYYNLGNLEDAKKYAQKCAFKNKSTFIYKYSQISYSCFYIKLLTALERYEERNSLIEEILPVVTSMDSLFEIYYDILDLCEHLLFIQRYEEFLPIVNHLEMLTKSSGIANLHLRFLKLKIQYYKLQNNETQYLHATSHYFELSDKMQKEANAITLSTIKLRVSLEESRSKNAFMEEQNRILQERSERDSLTGLPNRYRLNDYSEEVFDRAFTNQTYLAVEIFDIDYFKPFNDTYGHQAGDNCLCQIAQLLKNIMCQDIFCARYGGDEFVIIYENKTDEEILEIATNLKKSVEALQIEHKHSTVSPHVTISQGIRNSIPVSMNRMWDFLFAADAALYQVKRAQKNDILLVHKTSSQNSVASTIPFTNN